MVFEAWRHLRMSFLEYVKLDRTAAVRHEFIEGRVWAMAGGTLEHPQLAANVIREVGARLPDVRCKVFTADARVRALATGTSVGIL